jgi:hypothetical protein
LKGRKFIGEKNNQSEEFLLDGKGNRLHVGDIVKLLEKYQCETEWIIEGLNQDWKGQRTENCLRLKRITGLYMDSEWCIASENFLVRRRK